MHIVYIQKILDTRECFICTNIAFVMFSDFSLPVVVVIAACFWVLSTAWSNEVVTGQGRLLNHSEYCSINDTVFRNKINKDELLAIINDTGDWLVATNDSDVFVISAADISDCEDDDDYNPDIVIYAVQTSIYATNFVLATCTIVLHLYFKELQTVFGILITAFCLVLNIDHIVTFVHNRYQFTHRVNGDANICAGFVYVRGIFTFLYHTTKFTILFHFTYLMYRSYKMRSDGTRFEGKLLLKYVIFIVSLTSVYSIAVIPYDLAVTKSAFDTKGGYCAIDFLDDGTSVVIFIIQLSMIFAIELITFGIGIVFYFLVSKRFCDFKFSDIRVCFILVSTAGLNTLFFLVSYSASGGSSGITFVASSIGTFVEQSVLLVIFVTSKKVKSAIYSMVTSSSQ